MKFISLHERWCFDLNLHGFPRSRKNLFITKTSHFVQNKYGQTKKNLVAVKQMNKKHAKLTSSIETKRRRTTRLTYKRTSTDSREPRVKVDVQTVTLQRSATEFCWGRQNSSGRRLRTDIWAIENLVLRQRSYPSYETPTCW